MRQKVFIIIAFLVFTTATASIANEQIKKALEQAKETPRAYRAEETFRKYYSIIKKPAQDEWIFININLDNTKQAITLKMKKLGVEEIKQTSRDRATYKSFLETFNTIAKLENEDRKKALEEKNHAREPRHLDAERKRLAEEKERHDKSWREQAEYEKQLTAERIENQKQQERLEAEIKTIDRACKQAGYKGFAKLDLISMIYLTQKDGSLGNYLNAVVGNLKNDKDSLWEWYPKVKVFQVLENGALYSYSEFTDGELFSMTIHVENEPSKIYQEGQSLEDTFHVFNGMYTYIATTGAKKSIPSFSKAKIKFSEE